MSDCTMAFNNVFAMALKLERVCVLTCKLYTHTPCANKCNFLLQLQYRADLTWMKGAGCITEGSLNIQQAKKAGDLVSEVSKALRLQSVVCSKVHTHSFHYIMWNR